MPPEGFNFEEVCFVCFSFCGLLLSSYISDLSPRHCEAILPCFPLEALCFSIYTEVDWPCGVNLLMWCEVRVEEAFSCVEDTQLELHFLSLYGSGFRMSTREMHAMLGKWK